MTVYVPRYTIGRAALTLWRQVGKGDSHLVDAERVLQVLREPDPALVRRVAAVRDMGMTPEQVSRCGKFMIAYILAQAGNEQTELDKFEELSTGAR